VLFCDKRNVDKYNVEEKQGLLGWKDAGFEEMLLIPDDIKGHTHLTTEGWRLKVVQRSLK
jgi:hypothetical protein